MSLRLRLTLAYLMLLAPVLVMFSVVVYVIASHRIYGAVDDGLANRMTSIGPLLPNDHALGPADIQTALPLLDQASTTGFSFTILDVNGAHLYESPEAGHDIPASNLKPGDLQLSPRNAPGRDTRYSYQALTAPDGSTLGFIGAAVSLEPTDDALHELIGVFVVGGILMILITGIPTYVIAGRALQPIDDLSMLARDIEETADFRRRLSDKGLRGEVAELIRTFNAMIARVETMLDTQRRFFADSSHEMRRPLTIFRTNLDVIQNARLPEDERDACLDEMRIEATAMSDLVSDLLLLSRGTTEPVRRDPTDLSELCASTVRTVARNDSDHKYSTDIEPGVSIQGEGEGITHMLENLLENAAQNAPSRTNISLSLRREANEAVIRIADEGTGIPPEEQEHVFERFFRGRNARENRSEGAGLGLSIVTHVAEGHGGSVRLISSDDKGSCFEVRLPAEVTRPEKSLQTT